jgi:hypothetical protein
MDILMRQKEEEEEKEKKDKDKDRGQHWKILPVAAGD